MFVFNLYAFCWYTLNVPPIIIRDIRRIKFRVQSSIVLYDAQSEIIYAYVFILRVNFLWRTEGIFGFHGALEINCWTSRYFI